MKGVPAFVDDQLARRIRFLAEELSTPRVAVGPHIEAGDLIGAGHVAQVGASVLRVAPTEAVVIVVPKGQPRAELWRKERQRLADERRIGDRVHVGDGILEAEVERTEVVLPLAQDLVMAGHVVPVDHADLAVRLDLPRVCHPHAVGLHQEALVGRLAPQPVVHVLAGGDAEPCQKRVGQHHLANRSPQILDGVWIGLIGVDAVLGLRAEGEKVPRKPVDRDAAIVCVLHHVAPEADLLLYGHLPDDFDVLKQLRA
jgi:hypothetical protein